MFGLYEDRHHARFASDLLVENNPRLNVFALLRSGALTDGVVTRLKWGEKTCQLTAQRTGILLDDGEQQQRIAIIWHSPLPWIGKPAFVCPACNRDCYCLHEKAGVFACRKCHGMSYASRHLYRSVPGVHRVSRLRRKSVSIRARSRHCRSGQSITSAFIASLLRSCSRSVRCSAIFRR